MIKVKDSDDADKIEIIPREVYPTVGGAKPEPEELPAARIVQVEQVLTGNIDGKVLGTLPTAIRHEATVSTFAQGFRSMCMGCKHWDHEAWPELKRAWETSDDMEKRRILNNMRHQLEERAGGRFRDQFENPMDGDFDVEAALMSFGICRPFTEIFKDVMITSPMSCCPMEGPDGQPAPMLFEAKNSAVDKRFNESYDAIMRLAAGKK